MIALYVFRLVWWLLIAGVLALLVCVVGDRR